MNRFGKRVQRAYKKYFARVRAKTMTQEEFRLWSDDAMNLRDQALEQSRQDKIFDKV